jgi:hypothetical protein
MKNIAKSTSYGCYLDCDFVTAKYPEDETHIVGNVAEYVYDLEQKISDLEAKLAEKEAELVGRKKLCDLRYEQLKKQHQGKISFAVEQLENLQDCVEDKVNEYLYSHDMDNYDEFVTHQGMYCCFEIMVEIIDNQSKQLKETIK